MSDTVRLVVACLLLLAGTSLICLVAVRDFDRIPAAHWYLSAPVMVGAAIVSMLAGVLVAR